MSKKLYKKITPPKVGAPVTKKTRTNYTVKKKKVIKGKNPKNKNIMDTPMKNIPKALYKKTKQKVKNVLKNTPKENLQKYSSLILNKTGLKTVFNKITKKGRTKRRSGQRQMVGKVSIIK